MSARYTIAGRWEKDQFTDAGSGNVVTFVADLLDIRTGHVYTSGAYKVVTSGVAGRPRTRTFKGESAWNDARRYHENAVYWFRRQVLAGWG